MTQPLPTFSHTPRHIKEKIVDLLDTDHKFSLRQCSKDFKSVVDQSTISYEELKLEWKLGENYVKINLCIGYSCEDGIDLEFHPRPNGFLKKNRTENSEVFVKNGDFIGAAVEQFVKIFRNPKVFIQRLSIDFDGFGGEHEPYNQRTDLIIDKLNESLGALGHRVAVRHLMLSIDADGNYIRRVLPHLQPGTLDDLCFHPRWISRAVPDLNLNGIIEMEQWKQATRLHLDFFNLPLDVTSHFINTFSRVNTFTLDNFKYIIDKFLTKNTIWRSHIIASGNLAYEDIKQYLIRTYGANPEGSIDYTEGIINCTIRGDGVSCDVILGGEAVKIDIEKLMSRTDNDNQRTKSDSCLACVIYE